MTMVTEIESHIRGCGERVEGALYFFCDTYMVASRWFRRICECPCGNSVLKPSRNIQRFAPAKAFPELWINQPNLSHVLKGLTLQMKQYKPDYSITAEDIPEQLMAYKEDHAFAITIGAQHYATPEKFLHEAARHGISRRINSVPRGFVLGESMVYLIHPRAFQVDVLPDRPLKDGDQPLLFPEQRFVSGIIAAFKPTQIQYVTSGNESEEYLDVLVKRGITPVKVKYI